MPLPGRPALARPCAASKTLRRAAHAAPPPTPHTPRRRPLQGALCDDDAGVRAAAGGVFNVLFKSGGGSAMDSVIPALLGGLESEAHAEQVRAASLAHGAPAGQAAVLRMRRRLGCGVAAGSAGACWRLLAVSPAARSGARAWKAAPEPGRGQLADALRLELWPTCYARPAPPTPPTATHQLHPMAALQALEGLRVVLGVRPQLLSVMVPRLIKPPVTSTNLRALGALAEVAGGLRAASLHIRQPVHASQPAPGRSPAAARLPRLMLFRNRCRRCCQAAARSADGAGDG